MKKWLPFWLCLLALLPAAHAAVEGELLPPDQAYRFSASVKSADTVLATWKIADGYYLYRNKFQFKTDTPGVRLGTPKFPAGTIHHDEFFGNQEVYRHQVVIEIPVQRAANALNTLHLTVVSQGCADAGVCYPPQTQTIALSLPPRPAANTQAPGAQKPGPISQLSTLGGSLGLSANAGQFLAPDKAYVFSAQVLNPAALIARWHIAPGYYLYRDKFQFKTNTPGVRLGTPKFPAGIIHHDEFFGNQEIYRNQVSVEIPVQRAAGAPAAIHLTAGYQGCADAGVCYPPQTRTIALQLPAAGSASTPPGATAAATPPPAAQSRAPVSEQDRLTRLLAGHHLPLTLLTFYGLGLLLTFTPCVFPMIPILSSIIAGQGGQGLGTRRAFVLSLIYVLAMAVAYTAAGVIAALLGKNLQAAFQNPWVLGAFSAVFVLLALSMFGFYELRLPSFLHTRLTEVSNRQRGGSITGVAVMGLLSALIVSPCVTAPLVGALVYISQTRDAVLGGLALFALSMGMGTPLLVIGTTEGKFLPKAGPWMNTIKAIFGVVLLAVAIWLLQSVLPTEIIMLLWAGLLIVSAVYMSALEPLKEGISGWRKLWKGLGVVMLIYSALLLIGVAGGSKSVLQPLQGVGFTQADGPGPAAAAPHGLAFQRVKGLAGLDTALAQAKAQGKPVMLDFYADWCVSCKELEKYTFSDPGVQQALTGSVLLEADVTANDAEDQALMKHFGIYGPPAILFFGPDGKERKGYRVVGYMGPQPFRAHVLEALR